MLEINNNKRKGYSEKRKFTALLTQNDIYEFFKILQFKI